MRAPEAWKKKRILEALLIEMQNPTLTEPKDIRNLLLFRNGVT